MRPMVFLVLIAGATAHLHSFDTRNLIEREEPENDLDGAEVVECPVCENSSTWLSRNEECPIVRGGKRYKRCKYGAYINKACGNRRDCFRGPRDRCTEKMTFDLYDQRCAPGYYCNPTVGLCTGIDYVVDSNELWLVNPNHRYPLPDHRFPSNNFRDPIRAKRQV